MTEKKSSGLKIAVFHYHLLPGGVTKVITLSVRSVLTFLENVEEVCIVCGSAENAGRVEESLKKQIQPGKRDRIRFSILPELGYVQKSRRGVRDCQTVKRILKENFSDYFWWFHNYHLGKNPFLTQAVIETAYENPDQQILLHIHDFPECARYENLRFLRSFYQGTLYPRTGNVRYAVINGRDRTILRKAGIADEQVFLLSDPVTPSFSCRRSKKEAKKALTAAHSHHSVSYLPDAPLLLYPVRTIRRKNVLEAALIAQSLDEPVNLVTTLPGVSQPETAYSNLVSRAYEEGRITGLWGIGTHSMEKRTGIGFRDLICAADCVLSSSVQEGFGYLFVNSLQWGLPLFARKLDILESIEDIFPGESHRFYHRISVPAEKQDKDRLLRIYREHILSQRQFLQQSILEKLLAEAETLQTGGSIDFSYLPPDTQYEALGRLGDGSYRKDISALNNSLFSTLGRLLTHPPAVSAPDVDSLFGLEAFADTFSSIIESFRKGITGMGAAADGGPEPDAAVLDAFASIQYLRLLYRPFKESG